MEKNRDYRTHFEVPKNSISLDIQLAEQLLTCLGILRGYMITYPPEHPMVVEAMDRASAILADCLKMTRKIVVQIRQDTFFYRKQRIGEKNFASKNLARCLSSLWVVSVTFQEHCARSDLEHFINVIAATPAQILDSGGIRRALARAGIAGVSVKTLDLSGYRVTMEKQIAKPDSVEARESFSKDLSFPGPEEPNFEAPEKTWSEDSRSEWMYAQDTSIMSDEDPLGAIRNYEELVRSYVREIKQKNYSGLYPVLERMNKAIAGLEPELKERFLQAAVNCLSSEVENIDLEGHLDCFPQELIAEILVKASRNEIHGPSSLLLVFRKLAKAQEEDTSLSGPEKVDSSNGSPSLTESQEELLMDPHPEAREKYIPDEYWSTLYRVTDASVTGDEAALWSEVLHGGHWKALAEADLNQRFYDLLFVLMDQNISEDDYTGCLTMIGDAVPLLFRKHNVSLLLQILEGLRKHEEQDPTALSRPLLKSILQHFSDEKMMSETLTPSILDEVGGSTKLAKFLVLSGPAHLGWLLDLYAARKEGESNQTLLTILHSFGEHAINAAVQRLAYKEADYVRAMLVFLRQAGDSSVLAYVRQLLDHREFPVRIEAVAVLLALKDPEGPALLLRSLRSKDRGELHQAVALTCRCVVADLFPAMMSLVRTTFITKNAATMNEFIINEAGGLNDPRLVPYFEKILTVRYTLSPRRLADIKTIILKSLKNFPRECIDEVLLHAQKVRDAKAE
jgi:hypothetical protein